MRDEVVDFSSCDGQEDKVNEYYLTPERILSLPYSEFANIRANVFLKRQRLKRTILKSNILKYE